MAEQIEETREDSGQKSAPAARKHYGWIIFGSMNLILILLLGGAEFFLYQDMKDKHYDQDNKINKDDQRGIELTKQLNSFQSQLGTMQTQIATFGEDITGKDNHFTQTLADFSKLHNERLDSAKENLSEEINKLKRQLGKTRGDWLIADAEYLLSVANQRLHLIGDIKTASLALEAADQRLRESGDSAVFKVREQIAKELAGLRTVELTDIVGIYSRLQLLKGKIDNLAVLLPYAGKPLTESTQIHDHDQPQASEHGLLNSTLHLLEGYVTVKHTDQPVTEILTEEEVLFIRRQMGVKIELIKVALVQEKDVLFKAAIQDARLWLQQNFTKNTAYKDFEQAFDQLATLSLRNQMPDISQSLKMLKDITKLRLELDKAQIEPATGQSIQKAVVAAETP